MKTYEFIDVARGRWVENVELGRGSSGFKMPPGCSVTKTRLRGGRRDGVDLITVDNGALSCSVIPTRGMGIWRADFDGDRIGWDSPVADGPVHPSHVDLLGHGGIGWLGGFDELLARCGLVHNGAPYFDGGVLHPLHGRIANIPASYAAVHVSETPPHEIVIEGRVEESFLFGGGIGMITKISTTPGSNRLTVRDEFVNLKDHPVEMQILYHWNFGPPYLEEGAQFVAPIKTLVPRDARAAAGVGSHATYSAPEPGFGEQVYFCELHESGGETAAMLRDKAGNKGVVLRYELGQLPCFSLWKNTGGLRDGYVTGLEPGTNYPNPRPFEKARGRVLTLPVGGRHVAETTLEVLRSADQVAAVEAQIAQLQALGEPVIHPVPKEPFSVEG